jgi:hypothetical protein
MAKVVGGSRNTVDCSECGVTVRYKKSDIMAGEVKPQSFDDREAYVVCPPDDGGCGSSIVLSGKTAGSEAIARTAESDAYWDHML